MISASGGIKSSTASCFTMESWTWKGLLCFASVVLMVNASDRTLNIALNPRCPLGPEECAHDGAPAPFSNNLLYVISYNPRPNTTDPRYKIYWSTIDAPTVLIAEIAPDTDASDPGIAWPEFIQDNKPEVPFLVPNSKRYAGFALANLIEWDDVDNTGQLTNKSSTIIHPFAEAHWYNASVKTEGDGVFLATFVGTFGRTPRDNNITIELRAHLDPSRAALPPRMQIMPSSVTARIILNQTAVHFNHSRFALDMIFASNDSSRRPAVHSIDKSISDEFSPGIFTTEKISGADTYLQWRPVVYTAANPGVSDSTRSQTGSVRNATLSFNASLSDVPDSLLLGLAGITDPGNTLLRFNVSLGQTDDGFYNSTAYQDWTCELGLGQAPVDQPTSKIKLIIGIGFGVPAALILVGVVYVVYLKIKRRRREREAGLLVTETTTNYQTLG
ncbi:glycosylated lysosomal membrane protein B-like [Paramacrobiotus metropolitanus]|uniref:glycosylated lysosomal membrane protein B-like n=1 Tax=Paramacrobiotus metropolitanus TaxID=2943436 RepID=UPI002445EB82|nr:glycosylated lysosomal membrane protein B-like [Paramacrobiotus metropolitanus]